MCMPLYGTTVVMMDMSPSGGSAWIDADWVGVEDRRSYVFNSTHASVTVSASASGRVVADAIRVIHVTTQNSKFICCWSSVWGT